MKPRLSLELTTEQKKILRIILENTIILSAREVMIMKLRYGLGGIIFKSHYCNSYNSENEHTLEEIGMLFKVTRERIRQIEAKAIRILKRYVPFTIDCYRKR